MKFERWGVVQYGMASMEKAKMIRGNEDEEELEADEKLENRESRRILIDHESIPG